MTEDCWGEGIMASSTAPLLLLGAARRLPEESELGLENLRLCTEE